MINHWFLEMVTLMWTARLFCVSFLHLFFFEVTSCTAKKLTQDAHERIVNFSVHMCKVNSRKPLVFTELQLTLFLMESPIVLRILINALESCDKVGCKLLSQLAPITLAPNTVLLNDPEILTLKDNAIKNPDVVRTYKWCLQPYEINWNPRVRVDLIRSVQWSFQPMTLID